MLKFLLSLALVAITASCMSGCATPWGPEARGNATYDYNVKVDPDGKITACEVKIVSGREVQGSANIKACAPGGQLDVTASGALAQGADRSANVADAITATGKVVQDVMTGKPVTAPAPAPATAPTPHQ